MQGFDLVAQVLLGGGALLLEGVEFLADRGEFVFLLVELVGVAFGKGALFG